MIPFLKGSCEAILSLQRCPTKLRSTILKLHKSGTITLKIRTVIDCIIDPISSPLCIHMPFGTFFPLKEQNMFSLPLTLGSANDVLWPTEWIRSGGVGVLSLGLQRPHVLMLILLYLCHHHEMSWVAHWSQEDDKRDMEQSSASCCSPKWHTDLYALSDPTKITWTSANMMHEP